MRSIMDEPSPGFGRKCFPRVSRRRAYFDARALVILAAMSMLAAPSLAQAQPVQTDAGPVAGITADGVESFKGIPYAAPPVGALRWRAPQPVARWSGVRRAAAFGAPCMQPLRNDGPSRIGRAAMSEDCLTLNVFRPAGATKSARPLPVMVWIHGGGLRTGAASLPIYDGAAFARGGVVLVSFNYRLGRLGFFVHPALVEENADGGRLGSYGLMDQIAALQWVRRNIAAFGGDPGNVTIFGESAGGQSVDALMVSPAARGLFHKAISQSGYGRGAYRRISTVAPDGQSSAEDEGRKAAAAWGVPEADLAALRALPADRLVDQDTFDGLPNFYLDGPTFDADLWTVFRAGRQAPVPLIIGSNGLEFPTGAMSQAAAPLMKAMSEAERARIAAAYGDGPDAQAHVVSDVTFTGQVRALARMHARQGHPTWVYLFDVRSGAGNAKGAVHAAELRYVFDTLGGDTLTAHDDVDRSVAKLMNAQWRAFATRGDPTGEGLPSWPRYDGQVLLEYRRESITAHPDERAARLDALAEIIDPKS
jgi:para-nitrobenzyl esterase